MAANQLSPFDFTNCLTAASVPVILPEDPFYTNASLTWNLHYQYHPLAIAVPQTAQQVSAAVTCASSYGVKVQAKGGGHSYASFSAGGRDGSLIVAMDNFVDASVDASGLATVGSGNRLGNMATALYDQAQRALPHGSCPGVGLAGHSLHGGYGYGSRNWGLAMDTIVGLDVVLANGSQVHTTKDEYPDLFYAFRGAGESFGIVTTFYLQTQPAPTSLVHFSYAFENPSSAGAAAAADIVEHIQTFGQNSSVVDRRIGFGLHVDPISFSISGMFFGTRDEFANRIKPELLNGLQVTSESLQTTDWPEMLSILAEDQGPVITPAGLSYDEHDCAFVKSIVAPESNPITRDAWLAYFNYIIVNGSLGADASWYSIFNLYGGPDSQINVPAVDSSSYPDRSALFVFQHFGYTNNYDAPFPANIEPFIEGLNSAIPHAMPGVEFPAYVNYVDPSLTAEQAHQLYYGEETYNRLLAIKHQVDPGLVFWNPQAIGVV